MKTRTVSGNSYTLTYDKENRLTAISGSASARYVYDGDGKRVLAVENGVRTVYIGDYFEAELGSGTAFPVFVPDLDNTGLPNKFYLPIVKNGAGAVTPPPANPGNGFYFTHPIHPNQSTITWRMYYSSGDQRVAMRISHGPTTTPYPAPGATQDEVYYLLSDHLGSTTITVNQDGTVKSRVRYDAWGKTRNSSGTTPTDRKYTGQIEEAEIGLYFYNARWYDASLGRFIQADTIIPQPGSSLAWDRYSYVNNNPIIFTDTSGHRACESRDGYECDPKIAHLWDRADIILHRYGGKNDLEAMAKITNTAASLYGTYDEMIPALSGVFIGMESSNPGTLFDAAFNNTGCSGMGRDPGDCPMNDEIGEYFIDEGFHGDFRDGHNQLFHYWAYLTTTASAQTSSPLVNQFAGLMVGGFGNVFHEIIVQDNQSTWQDYGLAVSGMETGLFVNMNLIPPSQLGNFIRNDLGPGGYGGYGLVQLSVDLVPLQGNKK